MPSEIYFFLDGEPVTLVSIGIEGHWRNDQVICLVLIFSFFVQAGSAPNNGSGLRFNKTLLWPCTRLCAHCAQERRLLVDKHVHAVWLGRLHPHDLLC